MDPDGGAGGLGGLPRRRPCGATPDPPVHGEPGGGRLGRVPAPGHRRPRPDPLASPDPTPVGGCGQEPGAGGPARNRVWNGSVSGSVSADCATAPGGIGSWRRFPRPWRDSPWTRLGTGGRSGSRPWWAELRSGVCGSSPLVRTHRRALPRVCAAGVGLIQGPFVQPPLGVHELRLRGQRPRRLMGHPGRRG